MTHTPGPWRAETWNTGHTRIRSGINDTFVADINNNLPGQTGPNARLIAAAPDLLAALKTVRAHHNGGPEYSMQQIDAAIAKAEGKGEGK